MLFCATSTFGVQAAAPALLVAGGRPLHCEHELINSIHISATLTNCICAPSYKYTKIMILKITVYGR